MPTRTYTNYYHVLGLETPARCRMPHAPASAVPTALSNAEVKAAYRRAVLRAHPDKQMEGTERVHGHDTRSRKAKEKEKQGGGGAGAGGVAYTVDDVKQAYQTLGNAAMRTQYDRWLAHQFTNGAFKDVDAGRVEARSEDFVAGLESVDLSEFEEGEAGEEDEGMWKRHCRCGGEFMVKESQLDGAADRGESEVVVGCKNCSLWVRVAFGVEDG
ncbi:hypothetical protein K491DRAFT_695720 [Lophiostoma macrostomum CBS 122681]|uniref:Diphthamide biosynthesis protein 4 n=1 Tax=Lophiostoma macrostomum CBS 122681 TaxID=1314788 RepID=A0A6A6T152_9PLEO|nr:hypothetical protein K491DRAFT_695720 [Lophiostoma macrostomum CBS 122681]